MRFSDIAALQQTLGAHLPQRTSAQGDRASLFDPGEEFRHRYLCSDDFREMQQQIGILTPDLVLFCCADAECLHAPSAYFLVYFDLLGPLFRTYGRASALSQAVWETVGYPHVGLDPQGALSGFLSLFAGAELGEEQVVFGAEARIDVALTAACSLGSQSCLFHHACIGRVTGVDWHAIGRRVEARTGVSIVHDANIGLDRFHADLAAQVAAQPAAVEKPGPPRLLNLVGYRDDQGARDLVGLLELLGFGIASQPIPDLTGLTLAALQRADFQVLNPIPEYGALYDDVFRRLGTPTLAPAAPYGFARSLRWVETLCQHGGVELASLAPWRAYYERHLATFETLRSRAASHRVGLILTPEDGARLAAHKSTPFFLQLPLLEFLEEAGFGIDVLLTPTPGATAMGASASASPPVSEGRHSLTQACDDHDVEAWLAAPERRLVYSDLKRDLRLTAQGNATFSSLLLELGFEGACRTLEHLVTLCEMEYFHDYRHHRRRGCSPLRS